MTRAARSAIGPQKRVRGRVRGRVGGRVGGRVRERVGAGLQLVAIAVPIAWFAGCGTTSEVAPARAGSVADVRAAVAKMEAPSRGPVNATGKPLAILVTQGKTPELIAFDMAVSKVLWRTPAELTARAMIGRSVVVATEKGGALVGRDVRTGDVRWQDPAPSGGRRVGFAIDGDGIYYVVKRQGSRKGTESELVAIDGSSGAIRWRTGIPTSNLGGPAARGGLVAVPVRSQYVALHDGASGRALADVISREEAATFVRALPEGLFFGSKGVFLLDAETATGSRKAPGYMQAALPKFVRPNYHWEMYRDDQTDYSASDKNRILWRAAVEGPRSSFAGNMVFVHNFRLFFGFDARKGDLRWAYNNPRVEAVSSDHTGKAILFATKSGDVIALDAETGKRSYAAKVGDVMVRGATFDADGFTGGALEAGTPALAAALASIVWDRDKSFADAKIFAIDELSKQPGREVTGELLKVLDKEGIPPAIYQKAADSLVARKDKSAADLFVASLQKHSDYAADHRTHGVDVLAKAVAAMQAREAAPALVGHLHQPDTGLLAVAEIAEALVAMEARDTLPELKDFLLEYRADPSFAGDPAALIAVSEAVLRLGGPAERTLLFYVSEDPRTLDALRTHVQRALVQTARAGKPGAAK